MSEKLRGRGRKEGIEEGEEAITDVDIVFLMGNLWKGKTNP